MYRGWRDGSGSGQMAKGLWRDGSAATERWLGDSGEMAQGLWKDDSGSGEMALAPERWLSGTLAALTQDLGWLLSTHTAAYNHLKLQSLGIQCPLLNSEGTRCADKQANKTLIHT